jgi:hypothetical protein
VTCIRRNAKIAGLSAQLNLPLMQLTDPSFSTTAMNSAKAVPKDQLRQLEQQASAMCEEYLATLPKIPTVEIEASSSPAGIVSEMMQGLLRENRIQREAAEERLAAIHQLTEECERLRRCNATLQEQLCRPESPDAVPAT